MIKFAQIPDKMFPNWCKNGLSLLLIIRNRWKGWQLRISWENYLLRYISAYIEMVLYYFFWSYYSYGFGQKQIVAVLSDWCYNWKRLTLY